MSSNFPIPPQQAATLQALATKGELSGVDPSVLAAIETEEYNPAYPPAVNSSGHGGYFGLSEAQAAQHNVNLVDPATYATQAQIAAIDFNAQRGQYGGSNYAAETAYQQGKYTGAYSPGVSVFEQYGIPDNPSGPYPPLVAMGKPTPTQKAVLTTKATSTPPVVTNPLARFENPVGGLGLPGGKWDPLNDVWAWTVQDPANALWAALLPVLVMGFGILLIVLGIHWTFSGGTKLNVTGALTPGPQGEEEHAEAVQEAQAAAQQRRQHEKEIGEAATAAAVAA